MSDAMNSRKRPNAEGEAPQRVESRPPRPPARRPIAADDDEGPVELSEAQVGELRGLLEARREQILESINARREQERDAGREVGDEMDEANTEGVSGMTSKLLERDVGLLRQIDSALARIADGTYGRCEGTGEPIGYARLRSRPWARFSVAYQEELEREQRNRGGI